MLFTFEIIYLNIINLKKTDEILQLYGDETGTIWKIDQEHLESFEMWCRRMEKIS
jgi:hypothetical protein